ncbi:MULTISPECIES: glycosyltransferase [Micromonospora]|uniref:glycosyltransferase n=1 Tax=Micromonospora TaxID=1873 RepID=UPI00064C18DE|nr:MULTISPECIES: glycosyltransferase [Micromonospora]MDG4750887.1 glycosyltransferase [Micromonospora sp. WMMD718]UFN96866.1 glycosyltransferase [Micromonospora aurantiaca]
MRICHIAPVHGAIPPTGYGGIERVIHELCSVQARAGAAPHLYCSTDSTIDACTTSSIVPSLRSRDLQEDEAGDRPTNTTHLRWAVDDAIRQRFDVVHLHGPWGYPMIDTLLDADVGVVASVYSDTGEPEVQQLLGRLPAKAVLVANSSSTRAKAPQLPWYAAVLEGVLVEAYTPRLDGASDHLAFVGELTRRKGVDRALEVARRSGIPLRIAGRPRVLDAAPAVQEAHEAFLDDLWREHADTPFEYLGELGDARLELLRSARCLLVPIRWPEPFGRVMAEALALGTPVVAANRGAVPELVRHEVTGFVCDSVNDLVYAVKRVDTIDRRECRRSAERELNMDRVAREYTPIYREAIRRAGAR